MKHIRIILIALLILAILAPVATSAQDDNLYTVGLWDLISPDVFIASMTELGYVEGENITYLYPEDGEDDLETAQALIDADVDVIVTLVDSSAVEIMELTSDIPIVFTVSDDPVTTGAVDDLVIPGRNATGIVTNHPHERRFQILTEVNPATDRVYYLYPSDNEEYVTVLENIREIAADLDVVVEAIPFTDSESEAAMLDNLGDDVDWFFLTPFVFASEEMSAAALSHQIGISGVTNDITPGTLIGYGPDLMDTTRQAASIVDRILRGADPADLPVLSAENFLTINLEYAAAIGLDVPRSALRQADLIVRPGDFDEAAPSD